MDWPYVSRVRYESALSEIEWFRDNNRKQSDEHEKALCLAEAANAETGTKLRDSVMREQKLSGEIEMLKAELAEIKERLEFSGDAPRARSAFQRIREAAEKGRAAQHAMRSKG